MLGKIHNIKHFSIYRRVILLSIVKFGLKDTTGWKLAFITYFYNSIKPSTFELAFVCSSYCILYKLANT